MLYSRDELISLIDNIIPTLDNPDEELVVKMTTASQEHDMLKASHLIEFLKEYRENTLKMRDGVKIHFEISIQPYKFFELQKKLNGQQQTKGS